MLDIKNAKLAVLLKRMSRIGEFPAVSQHITEVNMKAIPSSLTNAIQLANTIVKDYSLTAKMLRLVNSAFYGQFAGKISSVSRAVVILGFEQVRLAASGLIFIEHMQNRQQAAELARALLVSFMSGMVAREMADRIKLTEADELFTCAMFHDLGKLLVIYYFTDEYSRIQEIVRQEKISVDAASRMVLGVTFKELGTYVGTSWNLPKIIIDSMAELPGKVGMKKNKEEKIHAITCFSNALCEIALDGDPEAKKDKMAELAQGYKEVMPFSKRQIVQLMDSAINKVSEYSDVLNLKKDQAVLLQKMSFRERLPATGTAADTAPVAIENFELREGVSLPGELPGRQMSPAEQLQLMTAMQGVTNAMLSQDKKIDDLLTMVLETAYQYLGFSHVIICIKDTRSESMQARFGLGEFCDEMVRKFVFAIDPSATDVFNRSLAARKDIYLADARAPELQGSLPGWYKGILKAAAFAVFPIVVKDIGIGLLYGAIKEEGAGMTSEKLDYMKTLRNQIVLAIQQKSAG